MLRWLFQFLYGSTHVRFASAVSVQESIARLAAVVNPSIWTFSNKRAMGLVSDKKVRIQRGLPLIGGAFRPILYGSFSATGTGCVLEGAFRIPTIPRVFMTIWFALIAFITLSAAVEALAVSTSRFLAISIEGLGLLSLGVLFVWVGKWSSRNDIPWLTHHIAHALGTSGVEIRGARPDL
ncbi:hypothetical protein [Cupriavidus sp.]|uniref:hypothetical protein n=1 Tax=Cupriavidus sp. TaxID=1873897 RepID=UPI0025BE927B|nr:hypothetical protein [Cupriavidus sp.]MCA3773463.1 hypothetical protein [Cutibacterium sp.]MCA3182780.1 hypothetical protein [Cupriavidus sp.]MCA3189099.1 hypothetical protein [Cupriavidus sp.]MCA3198818.1 hypothetical protein [Cupriavidus sp.]MCA3201563.1 hypothetical protein [Cupriavidus sp.]